MLKAVRKTFSVKLGRRVFVCLRNDELPPALREKVRPLVVGFLACWIDRVSSRNAA